MTTSHPNIFELLARGGPVVGPGVWDCLSARTAERAGFKMAFLSGYCLSASLLGEPDFGLLTQSQVLDAAQRIVAAVDIPIIVDIDTGYGNAFNVEQTVKALVRFGAAGCFLEDQVWPKRCGHMDNKRVIPLADYLPKLRAALEARGDAAFHVTARTDARAAIHLDEAIKRGRAFVEAGADAVFVEAPQSVEEMALVRRQIPNVPLVANMVEQGKTPLLATSQLAKMGYQLIAAPVAGLLASTHGLREALTALHDEESTASVSGRMLSFHEMNDLMGLPEKYRREREWLGEDDSSLE